jgi:hypothetical protein
MKAVAAALNALVPDAPEFVDVVLDQVVQRRLCLAKTSYLLKY